VNPGTTNSRIPILVRWLDSQVRVPRHGEHLITVQVGEEPNVTDAPNLDGTYPRITEALIAGMPRLCHRAHDVTSLRALNSSVPFTVTVIAPNPRVCSRVSRAAGSTGLYVSPTWK